jgi:hypothetical protein
MGHATTRCFAGSFPTLGAFRILVDIKHAHTPEASPEFPHQGDVDVDVLKPLSLWLPLPDGLSGLDFEGAHGKAAYGLSLHYCPRPPGPR